MTENNTFEKGITVYCGSSEGNASVFAEAAAEVGREIARAGLSLYYGGGHMGLMGAVGTAVRSVGGTTVAVIPRFMVERGWNDKNSTRTVITDSMHQRKEFMAAHARGVIALPGGVGTFEELCEIITWRQLGLFKGNIVVLNINGYYEPWREQFVRAVAEGFYPASHLKLFSLVSDPAEAVAIAAAEDAEDDIKPKF